MARTFARLYGLQALDALNELDLLKPAVASRSQADLRPLNELDLFCGPIHQALQRAPKKRQRGAGVLNRDCRFREGEGHGGILQPFSTARRNQVGYTYWTSRLNGTSSLSHVRDTQAG